MSRASASEGEKGKKGYCDLNSLLDGQEAKIIDIYAKLVYSQSSRNSSEVRIYLSRVRIRKKKKKKKIQTHDGIL